MTWKPSLRVVTTLARITAREILKDRVLYNCFLVAGLLLGVAHLASSLTHIAPERIVLNLGFAGLTFSCVALATLLGGAAIGKEVDRRTILLALSLPISRTEFMVGKFLGISWILGLNVVLLSVFYAVILVIHGGVIHGTLIWGLALLWMLSGVVAAMALFFSTLSNTALGILMTVGMTLIGLNLTQIKLFSLKAESPVVATALTWLAAALPNLESLTLGFKVTYGLPISWGFGLGAILYGLCWCAVFTLGAGAVLSRREI